MRKIRVERNPGGRPEHWLRASVRFRASVRACTGLRPPECARACYLDMDAVVFHCKECEWRRRQWLEFDATIEAMRMDLYEGQN